MNCRRGSSDLISRFDKPHDDFTKHLNFHDIFLFGILQASTSRLHIRTHSILGVEKSDNLDLSTQIYDCRS